MRSRLKGAWSRKLKDNIKVALRGSSSQPWEERKLRQRQETEPGDKSEVSTELGVSEVDGGKACAAEQGARAERPSERLGRMGLRGQSQGEGLLRGKTV